MPLIGLIDPSHDERAADEQGRPPNWFTVDELMDKLLNNGPKWSNWTYEMAQAVMAEWQERDYISTTMLTGGCPRGTVLERKMDFIYSLDLMYKSARGTQVHRTLENSARAGAVAEARFKTTVYIPHYGDVEFSCSPDLVRYNDPSGLDDYKVSDPPSFDYPRKKHSDQLQLNRWVVNHAESWTLNGAPFDIPFNPREWQAETLAVIYLGQDYPKTILVEKTQEVPSPNYAKNGGKMVKRRMPYVMSDEDVEENLLMPRLTNMVHALESFPDWPQGLEHPKTGWGGEPGWKCPGPPLCWLPNCLAKRWPHGLVWEPPE